MTTDDDLRRAFDFTAGDERLTPAWQPYTIEAHDDGTATWHCHHCDDAKHHPDPDAARTDADAHHDLWHTNGGDK